MQGNFVGSTSNLFNWLLVILTCRTRLSRGCDIRVCSKFTQVQLPITPSQGPRFFYRMPEESRLDSYKKGTFLEKAERFPFDKRIEDFSTFVSVNLTSLTNRLSCHTAETKEVFKPTAKPSNVTNLIHLQSQVCFILDTFTLSSNFLVSDRTAPGAE